VLSQAEFQHFQIHACVPSEKLDDGAIERIEVNLVHRYMLTTGEDFYECISRVNSERLPFGGFFSVRASHFGCVDSGKSDAEPQSAISLNLASIAVVTVVDENPGSLT
jgi:hypothetical protein